MPLLHGYDPENNKTGEVYGRYAHGVAYEHLLRNVEANNSWIRRDLELAGVYHDLTKLTVMDVGLGRQALSMKLLGAKEVNHYDLSFEQVAGLSSYILEKNLQNISSQQCDLCNFNLPSEKYDFVYLNGIVHHLSNTAGGLKNCSQAVKVGGKIWVYFYRSGTFKWFVCQMIRDITNANEIDSVFKSAVISLGDVIVSDDAGNGLNTTYPAVTTLIDDFFAPYIHLYPPIEYIEFMGKLGFQLSSSSNSDPLAAVSHDLAHHSAVLVFERTVERDISAVDTGMLLTPENDVDQLSPDLYISDLTKRAIDLFADVKQKVDDTPDPATSLALRMRLHRIAAPQYYGEQELPPRYEELIRILQLFLKY
ncbi:MAG: methyltransferase domain-containing protein [Proteobacteria bacterium]|nr:methyltransferase domain-containing protein [Pseudomonadota bacterium]